MTSLIRAAVLVPVQTEADGQRGLVLIQRAADARDHPGQVAFPGGRYDPQRDDSLIATALREAEEEVGLVRSTVRVIGALPDQRTLSTGYLITPFIGEVPVGILYRPDGHEVESVFVARLSAFGSGEERDQMDWSYQGQPLVVPCVRVEGHIVWGVTLRIIDTLLRSDLLGYQE